MLILPMWQYKEFSPNQVWLIAYVGNDVQEVPELICIFQLCAGAVCWCCDYSSLSLLATKEIQKACLPCETLTNVIDIKYI